MVLSIVNRIYCFQSFCLFICFFFFACIGQDRFGWKEHQIQWKNGLGMWLGVPGAEGLSAATPFLQPRGFWPMLLSSLCSPASVLFSHHTQSSQQLPAQAYSTLQIWPHLCLTRCILFLQSQDRLSLDAGSLAGTCHLSWLPFPFGVGRGWEEEP